MGNYKKQKFEPDLEKIGLSLKELFEKMGFTDVEVYSNAKGELYVEYFIPPEKADYLERVIKLLDKADPNGANYWIRR